MFSNSQTRIILLTLGAIASWMLFYFDGFAGFAPDYRCWKPAKIFGYALCGQSSADDV